MDSKTVAQDGGTATELSPREAAALDRVRYVSRLLDEAVRIPGTEFRIGLDPIVGVLPIAGDIVSLVLSLYPVLEAYRLGVPRRALARMLAVVGVDAVSGLVPVVGDVFDAVWKANERNVRVLERHLDGA